VASTTINLRRASRVLTDQLTCGLRTVRFGALPITLRFFTNGLTFGLGSLAMSYTVRLFADSDTLGAISSGTSLIGTLDFTNGLLTFHITNCISGFSATCMANGRFADWLTNSGALGIVTLPCTFRVALLRFQI